MDAVGLFRQWLAQPDARAQVLEHALAFCPDPADCPIFGSYRRVVEAIRAWRGEPVHEGLGPRWGDAGPLPPMPSPDTDYSHAVRLAWWEGGGRVLLVLLTGHDADTLLVLHLAVSAGPPLT